MMPKIPFWIFMVLTILYFSSARVDVMDVDAAQYAEISREMMQSGDYLHVYDLGYDYLDKPPFLFWTSALSMKVFGVNNFAYKLPSILFALWALFALYRLARLLYDEKTARMAALILGSCQGMFLWTNDIRTDTILMSWTVTAIWLIKEWELSNKLRYLLLGCASIAFGMMTKGPIALMVPVFCFASDWILKRDFSKFLKWEYLLGVLVIVVLLVPMCVGLYQQYDLQPDKVMDGKTNISGIRFFFWTQSFGRITGENTWDNGAPFSFLFENMLWSFLPWIILFVVSFLINIFSLAKQKLRLLPHQEWISTGGFLVTYVSLAFSHYQLPHYIFIGFPLASIMVAVLLQAFFEGHFLSVFRVMKPVQTVISFLLMVAAFFTFAYVFKGSFWWYILWFVGLIILCAIYLQKKNKTKILWGSVAAIIIANIFMTNHFYYELLKYQSGSQVGKFILQKNIPAQKIQLLIPHSFEATHFYSKRIIGKSINRKDAKSGSYLITNEDTLQSLHNDGVNYDVINSGKFFKVSELTSEFLNPETREKALDEYYLVLIK